MRRDGGHRSGLECALRSSLLLQQGGRPQAPPETTAQLPACHLADHRDGLCRRDGRDTLSSVGVGGGQPTATAQPDRQLCALLRRQGGHLLSPAMEDPVAGGRRIPVPAHLALAVVLGSFSILPSLLRGWDPVGIMALLPRSPPHRRNDRVVLSASSSGERSPSKG